MIRNILLFAACSTFIWTFGISICTPQAVAQVGPDWPQWSRTPQHTGATPAVGQDLTRQLADITFDPFVSQEQAEGDGDLLAHYQVPLVDGNFVFLEYKTGNYVSCDPPGSGQPYPCGPDAWSSEIWNERAFAWKNGALVEVGNFQSDWKPEPNDNVGGGGQGGLFGWEPVFHAVLGNGHVYVPGASGSVYKIKESDGSVAAHYMPFGTDANTFVSGPLTIDQSGNVYYNVLALDPTNPWTVDIRSAALVKITPAGAVSKVSFSTLVQGSPSCGDASLGSQRPGINVAPAISADGKTIYTVSRAHFDSSHACLLAVNANLTSKGHVLLATSSFKGQVADLSSSTPSVAPDGSVLFGVLGGLTGRGHLMKFDASGQFSASYNFGWDETPAIYAHDGTYSVIIKDNHYASGGPYYITQLNAQLVSEWKFNSPDNYEWCVNAPAVDANGTVYANSEDGNVYVINQGGTLKSQVFLRLAIGAAYTPIALGRDGKVYTENDGDMFVEGK